MYLYLQNLSKPMKIIIAIDSFKGSLTSFEAGEAVRKSILQVQPTWQTEIIPVADGGEGMMTVMLNATQGKPQSIWAHDPCMKLIKANYGISADGKTAFIEMATISGLPLIQKEQQNPMKTTTYGTGELIRDALEKGCDRFIIGIGGSATNDAGTGMLQALGFRFLNAKKQLLGTGGEILSEIASIDTSEVCRLLANAHFIVACDVTSPFYGPEGAAHVFARQKGADDAMIDKLDKGMRSFAKIIKETTGKDIAHMEGSGAAGGMGGGMSAFLNAQLKPGADLLLDICDFDKKLTNADLIITGEGCMDRQSLMGKITGKILKKGKERNIPVIAIVGCAKDETLLKEYGFSGVYPTKPKEMPLETALKKDVAKKNIQETVSRLFSTQHG